MPREESDAQALRHAALRPFDVVELDDPARRDAGLAEEGRFAEEVRRRFPDAVFAFNYSSSFRWDKDPDPISFDELGALGYRFIFVTLAAQHAASLGIARLFEGLRERGHEAYVALQREEWAEPDLPTKSHHFFSGVPYHQHLGKAYDASRLGDVSEHEAAPEEARV